MAEGGVHDFRLFAVALEQLGADLGMAAFHLVVGRLADVVQQAAAAGQVAVEAHFFGHHAGEERDFDRVPQHVLAVAGAEVQPAEQLYSTLGCTPWTSASWTASSPIFWMCASISFCVSATTSSIRVGWMRPSAISLFSDMAGDFAADGVEAADDDHAGRVVDDHVDAGGLFEGADVAAFAADDAALHFVAGNIDRAGRGSAVWAAA